MKKAFHKKFSSSSKFVGKVFQRHKSCNVDVQMSESSINPIKEVQSLKEQIDSLNFALDNLKLELENKDVKLAKLARDKEKLSLSLAKMKRTNESLTQQLEDERNFYYKEKEMYCSEMNEFKKLKKSLSGSNVALSDAEEATKLKKTLEHTLQTNYNLSVKFLRMKETKNYLSKTLEKTEEEHKKVIADLKSKIDQLTAEMNEILDQKFHSPLSPSNKKYLQLLNRNSSLVYENLNLRMQIENLNSKTKNQKMQKSKSETNTSKRTEYKVIKIFEKEKKKDLPSVTFLNEKEALRMCVSEKKLKLPSIDEQKLDVFQVSRIGTPRSDCSLTTEKKRCRSAPKIVQSVSFKDSTPTTK